MNRRTDTLVDMQIHWVGVTSWTMGMLVAATLAACTKSDVRCGDGTELKEGVCVVALKQAAVASAVPTQPKPAVETPPPAKAPEHTWKYSHDEDKMRAATTDFAALTSTNSIEFQFPYNGGTIASIVLRKGSPGSKFGKDVMLGVNKGQFGCSYDGCAIAVKIDDAKVQTKWAHESDGGNSKTIFLTDYDWWVSHLATAKSVTIEAKFFGEGARQFTFDVGGLKWDAPVAPERKAVAAKPEITGKQRWADVTVEMPER